MLILNDTRRQIELAVQLDRAFAYLLSLDRGMKKLFDDGHDAHQSNSGIKPSQIQRLAECEVCSRIEKKVGEGPLCVDNDAWKKFGDEHDFGEVKPSVDLLLFAEESSDVRVVMVEAKLGSATRRKGDAPKRPSHVEICDKYDWSVKRISGHLSVHRELWLLVSSNTFQKMRQKVRRWNQSDSAHPIVCACCSDFLSQFGVSLVDSAIANNCSRGV